MVESPVVDSRRQMRVIRGGSEFERSTTSHFLLVVSSLRGLDGRGTEEEGEDKEEEEEEEEEQEEEEEEEEGEEVEQVEGMKEDE